MNIFAFFMMGPYVNEHNTFINQMLYYLTIIIIVGTTIISYFGYRDLSNYNLNQKILANIIFWIHIISLAIFLGSLWYAIS